MAYIEINKNNFFKNLDYFSNIVGDKKKLSIALKDNAYGHGIRKIARLCIDYGIENVFVKNDDEASLIRNYNFKTILVLYGCNNIKYTKNTHIAISSIQQLKKIKKNSKIELKIDTGMHRNGINVIDIENAMHIIKYNNLKLKAVFTHFASADEDSTQMQEQEKIFLKAINTVKERYEYKFKIHCANTSAVHKINNEQYDMARIGIGAYGYIDLVQLKNKLKPVMSLIAEKISTRTINKNETIGYGSKAYVNKKNNFKVSNYDIGYGDGFFRLDENKIFTLENGKNILGRISMDSLSVEGDASKIILFTNVESLAKVHNTISYEILTNLSPFLKRKIVE